MSGQNLAQNAAYFSAVSEFAARLEKLGLYCAAVVSHPDFEGEKYWFFASMSREDGCDLLRQFVEDLDSGNVESFESQLGESAQ